MSLPNYSKKLMSAKTQIMASVTRLFVVGHAEGIPDAVFRDPISAAPSGRIR